MNSEIQGAALGGAIKIVQVVGGIPCYGIENEPANCGGVFAPL
jgi:hypothetical protein